MKSREVASTVTSVCETPANYLNLLPSIRLTAYAYRSPLIHSSQLTVLDIMQTEFT